MTSVQKDNIKEMLLKNHLQGNLVDDIIKKYDAILTYNISIFTMITGTTYNDEFKDEIIRIMDSLGSSSTIISMARTLHNTIEEVKDLVDSVEYKKIFHTSIRYDDNKLNQIYAEPPDLPEYIKSDSMIKKEYYGKWDTFINTHLNILDTLEKLNKYFGTVIHSVNEISTALFSKGFRASIPKDDVDVCEKAGIHLKNLVTFQGSKSRVKSEHFDNKIKKLRLFENKKEKVNKILAKKSKEELIIRSIPANDKMFSRLFKLINQDMNIWERRGVFKGYSEESIIESRILDSINRVFDELILETKPFVKKPINSVIYKEIKRPLQKIYMKIQRLSTLVLETHSIIKNLWVINKDYVIKISEDPKYFNSEDSNDIKELIASIPGQIKKEFQQRLIEKDMKIRKTEIYEILNEEVRAYFNEFSINIRNLLVPFSPEN